MGRILFVAGSFNQGGAEKQLLELAILFQKKQHKVLVISLTDYDFYKEMLHTHNIEFQCLSNDFSRFRRAIILAKKIRKFKPNLIFSYLRAVSQVTIFSKFLSMVRAKLVVGERTSLILPKHDYYYFNLLRFSNFITVNSLSKFDYIKKRFPFLKNKTHFFPNIIDVDNFNPKRINDSSILKLGFIGRLSPEKNVINILKAIKYLIHEGHSINIQLYGDTRNSEYLKSVNDYIKENNLEEAVAIKGKTPNIKEVYQKIDLLCLVSDYEGFSNVISEALCSGLPVVTSDVPENKYLIEDKVNGFVVNQKEPLSIAEGIEKYINLNLNSKKQISINNRQKAQLIFDKDLVYDNYLRLIDGFDKK